MKQFVFLATISVLASISANKDCCGCFDFCGETPPRNMCVTTTDHCCATYLISVDYILWYVREAGLMTTASRFANTGLIPDNTQKILYPRFYLSSGFKVGTGFSFDCNCWNLFFQYTWLYNKGHSLGTLHTFISNNDGMYTLPSWLIGSPAESPLNTDLATLQSERSSWNNFFNRLDGILSQVYWVDNCFSMRPFLGVLGWWNSQTLRIEYEALDRDHQYHLNASQRGVGVGPYLGQEIDFYFYYDSCNQMSIWGKWGGALLWSQFIANVLLSWEFSTIMDQVKQKSRNVFRTTAPMLETVLGLRWQARACNDICYRVQVGWELSAWFDHNHMISNLMTRSSGTCDALYIMQGLTINLQMGF